MFIGALLLINFSHHKIMLGHNDQFHFSMNRSFCLLLCGLFRKAVNHVVVGTLNQPNIFIDKLQHFSSDEGSKPSIAGVVCTLDRACSKYASRIRLQHHRRNRTSDEIIRDFKVTT